jgi:phospholipase/carboxylesterase
MPLTRHDDLSLRYVLNVPSGKADDVELPMVVILHGRGADAYDLADVAPMIDIPGGCRFVFPNAARPFEPYPGQSFGWSWFDGWPPQGKSLAVSRELMLGFLHEITARYRTPTGRVVLGGFSQGALMAFDVGFRTDVELSGVLAMSGAIFEGDLPDFAARKTQNVLVIHGTGDDVIPVLAARRARLLLEEQGLSPEYHEFPMGHNVTEESMAVVREFLVKCVGE